jgi:protocatechuate 3,4-dioxygenase beta subunit
MVKPQQTEGPYFVDEKLNRSDIRSDPTDGSVKQGVPLRLVFHVSQVDGSSCKPLTGATVDVWHCNALGVYSDVTDRSLVPLEKSSCVAIR